ncbi:E3 ubiquitin-protein transferase rmnd5a [Homalodisca vitripennis]|nr:E3 ubiquitin-protein transferase rmnd5a [Homalodisca vitripennis]
MERQHGKVDFFLTYFFSDHGYFRSYLHRMWKWVCLPVRKPPVGESQTCRLGYGSPDHELTASQVVIMKQAMNKVRETVQRLATDHRDLHSTVSKVGKAIDRKCGVAPASPKPARMWMARIISNWYFFNFSDHIPGHHNYFQRKIILSDLECDLRSGKYRLEMPLAISAGLGTCRVPLYFSQKRKSPSR